MTYKIDDMLKMQIHSTDENGKTIPLVHSGTDKPYYIFELLKYANERNLRKNKRCAFDQKNLDQLHNDRANGMSIRELSFKHMKSTRTIQKYLKIDKIE